MSEYGWPGLALAALGVGALLDRGWRLKGKPASTRFGASAVLALASLGYLFFAAAFNVPDPDFSAFLIPLYLILALLMALGVQWLLDWTFRSPLPWLAKAGAAVAVGLLALFALLPHQRGVARFSGRGSVARLGAAAPRRADAVAAAGARLPQSWRTHRRSRRWSTSKWLRVAGLTSIWSSCLTRPATAPPWTKTWQRARRCISAAICQTWAPLTRFARLDRWRRSRRSAIRQRYG